MMRRQALPLFFVWLAIVVLPGCRCVDASKVRLFACADGACAEGSLCCDGFCVAGTECPAPQPCAGGFMCGTQCVDLTLSDAHCGACNVECTGATTCAGGRCVPRDCASGQCAGNQVCLEETCLQRKCVGKFCRDTEVCVEGECRSRLCVGALCGAGQECLNDVCTDVSCIGVSCPGSATCLRGRCDAEGGCATGMRDGTEAAVDCGGEHCASCPENAACSLDSQCAGFSCLLDGGVDGGVDDAGIDDGGLDGGDEDGGLADAGSVDAGLPPNPGFCARLPMDSLDLTFAALLFRLPDAQARTAYASDVALGRVGMRIVATNVFASQEFKALKSSRPARQRLRQLYGVFLGRELDATGEAIYLPLLYVDRDSDVISALIASREFSTRFPEIP
jgi:hypothetical protein